ncbi:MAG: hypothetical protein WCC74_02380 [Minisyncoccia bacterium]
MKKYILISIITLSLAFTMPFSTKATEKDLSVSEIRTIIDILISVGAIPQDKIAWTNFIFTLLKSGIETTAATFTQATSSNQTSVVSLPISTSTVSLNINNNIQTPVTLTPLGGSNSNNNSSSGSPYLSSGSADSQFVSADTSSTIAYYNFIANYGPAIIKEMYFTTTGSSVSNGDSPITSVIVGGVSAPVVGTLATLTGLNITVPIGNAGYNIPVAVTFAKVGLGGIASNKTAGLILTGYKYSSGMANNTVGGLSVSTNLMTVVSSKPTLSISNPVSTKVGAGGVVEIARVTISADSAGPIKVNTIPLSMNVSGNGLADSLSVKVGDSNVSLTSGDTISIGTTTATTSLVILGGYNISAGSSAVFRIFANTSFSQQNRNADTLRTSLGDKIFFVWTDVNGNATSTGEMIYNYPANTAIVSY